MFLLTDYSGLFDDFGTEDGDFDPMIFVDCDAESLCIEKSDETLLHEGSVIKILCGVLQAWGQGGYPARECYWVENAKLLLKEKRLEHLPYLKEAMIVCIESDTKFYKLYAEKIYTKYVLGYFKKLCKRK